MLYSFYDIRPLICIEGFQTAAYKKRTLTNLFRYASRIIHLLFYARGQLDEEGISYSIPLFSLPELKNAYVTQFDARITRREYKKKKTKETTDASIFVIYLAQRKEYSIGKVVGLPVTLLSIFSLSPFPFFPFFPDQNSNVAFSF